MRGRNKNCLSFTENIKDTDVDWVLRAMLITNIQQESMYFLLKQCIMSIDHKYVYYGYDFYNQNFFFLSKNQYSYGK